MIVVCIVLTDLRVVVCVFHSGRWPLTPEANGTFFIGRDPECVPLVLRYRQAEESLGDSTGDDDMDDDDDTLRQLTTARFLRAIFKPSSMTSLTTGCLPSMRRSDWPVRCLWGKPSQVKTGVVIACLRLSPHVISHP